MAAYFILLAVIASLMLLSLRNSTSWPHVAASGIVGLFIGLGYEVGYDWLAYSFSFWWTPTTAEEFAVRTLAPLEPLYFALNLLVKLAGGNFQALLFVCALINVAAIHYVTGRISRSQAAVWTLYIGIALVVGPFNVLRQTLASSFILISLLWWAEDKKIGAAVAFAAALGFHISAAMFVVILPFRRVWPSAWAVLAFLLIGGGVAATQVDTFTWAVTNIAAIAPGWIGDKLLSYQWSDDFSISTGSLFLIGLHLAFLAAVYRLTTSQERKDPIIILAVWLTIFVLGCHLYLSAVPSFWNRAMLVSLPWQVAVSLRLQRAARSSFQTRTAVASILVVVSAGSLWYSLRSPQSAPFAYRSIVEQIVADDHGAKRTLLLEATRCFHPANKLEYTLYAFRNLGVPVARPATPMCPDGLPLAR